MICGFLENGLDHESYSLLGKILEGEEALVPDVGMLVTVLPLYAGNGEVNMGMVIHSLAVKLGLNQELMLLTLTLVLPVATASVERAFSAMKIVKTPLRNKMRDQWLSDSMVVYIERDVFALIDNEPIM
ncbi:hypothetical protein ACFX19_006817 [Malus domestica]